MPPLPAACHGIRDQIKTTEDQVQQIQSSPGYIQGAGDSNPGKPNPEDLAEVKRLQNKVKSQNSQLNNCLVQNLDLFPIRIAVTGVSCTEEQELGILQDDEPYVLVAGVDLVGGGVLPALTVTLYGPAADVNVGESASLPGPPFWALDNESARVIADPDDVIFLVACLENDDGTAEKTRLITQDQSTAVFLATAGQTREQRVQQLMLAMNGAVLSSRFALLVSWDSHSMR
jgi:hypothetical protein